MWIAKSAKYPSLSAVSHSLFVSMLLGPRLWIIRNDSVACDNGQGIYER